MHHVVVVRAAPAGTAAAGGSGSAVASACSETGPDVSNPARVCRGVVDSSVDGVGVNADAIPLALDGGTHQVRIRVSRQTDQSASGPPFAIESLTTL
jgi:hypothetical protein